MSSNRLLLLSYNVGKIKLRSEYVADEVIIPALRGSKGVPKFVVIGLQEVCPIMDGCFGDTVEYMEPILKGIEEGLERYLKDVNEYGNYVRVGLNSYGAVSLVCYVYVGEGVENPVEKVLLASTGCGYLRSSLKGGVGIRLVLQGGGGVSVDGSDDTVGEGDGDGGGDGNGNGNGNHINQFTFITAHLTANEGMVYYRNRDYFDIVTMLDFGDGYGAYNPDSHLFFLGDLNYRCIEDPFGDRSERSEEAMGLLSQEGLNEESIVDFSKFSTIDELSIAKANGDAFLGFSEPPITFSPTFKFFESTQTYNRKRIPSWCDRILYLGYNLGEIIESYNSLPNCTESDHKPVYLSIIVPNSAPKILNDHRNLLLPKPSNTSTSANSTISFALSRSRSYNNSLIGFYADKSIGWGLYLSGTQKGRIYSLIGGFSLLFIYIYLFLF